jgi:hypothetical protein
MGSSSTLTRRITAGIVCTILIAFGAVALLGLTAWAERGSRSTDPQEIINEVELRFARDFQRRTSFARPEGLTPLKGVKPTWEVAPGLRRRTIETPLGLVDPGRLDDLRSQLPEIAGARGKGLTGQGRRGNLGAGYAAIQVSEEALRARTMDSIEADLGDMGVEIHGRMPARALLVKVPGDAVEALSRADYLEAAMAWAPMFKIDPTLGRVPFVQRSRAAREDLSLIVTFFRGADLEAGRAALAKLAKGPIVPWSMDGLTFHLEAHHSTVGRMARREEVRYIAEQPEMMLFGSEIPTIAMVGNVEENLPFQQPYHDVGVDGGGIDTNTDGRRVNNGTDAVPPQIVAVTDNGISLDSVQFSQTATQVTTTLPPAPIGPSHRKVHSIQPVVGSGEGCDALLSGGGTHGNVVAGVAAGDATSLGFTMSPGRRSRGARSGAGSAHHHAGRRR